MSNHPSTDAHAIERPPGKATATARLSPLPFLHRRSTAPIAGRTSSLGALAQEAHKSGGTTTYDAPNVAPFGALAQAPGAKDGVGAAGLHHGRSILAWGAKIVFPFVLFPQTADSE